MPLVLAVPILLSKRRAQNGLESSPSDLFRFVIGYETMRLNVALGTSARLPR